MTRKQIFEIIEKDDGSNVWSHLYDVFMFVIIILSVVPLMFWDYHPVFIYIEIFTTTIFIIDYILRWVTADYKIGKGTHSFVSYPYSFWAIIDLLSILPSFQILGSNFKILRTLRMLKILRLLKVLRYSEQVFLFVKVLKKEQKVLSAVLLFAAAYIFVTALVMFNFEPRINPNTGNETFRTFFDAVIALPSGIITASYLDELRNIKEGKSSEVEKESD